MSHRNTNEIHIYVANANEKDAVRKLINREIPPENRRDDYLSPKIYSLEWNQKWWLSPNHPSMAVKPMVNLKELQEILLLISLGIPAEEAISTITKQGYES